MLSFFLSFSLMGASCKVKEDTSPLSAIEAGDETVIFKGYGSRSAQGLLHVRVSEGAIPNGIVTIFMPEIPCKRDACAEIKAIRDGNIYPIGAYQWGQYQYRFKLSTLIREEDSIQKSQGGIYRILIDYFYNTDEGEMRGKVSGKVYLTVLEKGYTPVACNSPDIAFDTEIFAGCFAQFTSKGRSVLCGKCR